MTLSRDARGQNVVDALCKMSEDVGEQAVWRVDISIESDRYKDIYATTWKWLLDQGLIKWLAFNTYQLTYEGWLKGIQLRHHDESPVFRAKMSSLASTLKNQVKGRREEAYLDVSQVSALTGLTEDFIFNAIESRLLDNCFNMIGATLDNPNSSEIVIPIDFGQEPF
jgi:hypothetical protein